MPGPSGISWGYVSNVTELEFSEASAALDRALLRAIGLPEAVEIREFENAVYAMADKVNTLIDGFSVAKFIGILPTLIADGDALWTKLESKLSDSIERKEFIAKVIRYVYRKHDPDLPVLVEPFETIVEDMILDAVPRLIENLERELEKLTEKLRSIFGG